MPKKKPIKKKKKAAKKPLKANVKPQKRTAKKKKDGIPFKVPFGNIILSGNAQPTANAEPGMAFPTSYQLSFTGKNKAVIGVGDKPIGFSFLNNVWIFQGVSEQLQQQAIVQQLANSIGNVIINFFQKQ